MRSDAGQLVVVRALRIVAGALALVVIGYQFSLAAGQPPFSVVDFFSYFTIESNVLAACVLLACGLRPGVPGRLRGAATLYMVITAIVYATLLTGENVGLSQPWINGVLHRWMPLIMLADWLLIPPAPAVRARAAMTWLAFPALYGTYSLIHGAITGWYPYPFLSPVHSGYGRVALTVVILGAGMAALALVIAFLPRRTTPQPS